MSKCVYCHEKKGKRSCPALGGLICSLCCGEHRGVAIRCPADCIYFESNESYQRERVGEQFEETYQQVMDDLVRRSSQKAAMILNLAGWVGYRHARKHSGILDWEIRSGLEDVRQRLSPLAIPNKTGTPFGDILWREIQEFLKTERLDPDSIAAGIDAAHHLIATISGDSLKTNRYLKGLIHYMESHYPGPTQQMAKAEKTESGLILPADRLPVRQRQAGLPAMEEKRIVGSRG